MPRDGFRWQDIFKRGAAKYAACFFLFATVILYYSSRILQNLLSNTQIKFNVGKNPFGRLFA